MTPPTPLQRYKLPRNKILRSQKAITGLFQPGFFVSSYPLRINYQFISRQAGDAEALVLFSVSKKRFKKATQRNRIKRLMREVYRLNQLHIKAINIPEDHQLTVALIYTGQELLTFQVIKAAFLLCIQKMERKINHA